MKIVPAILAERENDFFFLVKQAEAFTSYVQIDIMDGFFVPSHSFPVSALNRLKTGIDFEIHLMVKHPAAFMIQVAHPRLKKVIYHFESDVKHRDFINQLKKRGIASGLAIKPDTPLQAFSHIAGHVDTLLFMTVDPGYYGSPFKPAVLEKIQETRSRFNNTVIAADGGVSLSNLQLFLDAGVDYACVGSRIFHGDNPGENYSQFLRRLEEIEKVR
ncbi:MAG: hypothetical protein MUO31_04485 [Thermodesulfovibrionales bacterium]|nr:hypothetical protein [Thermodesulfovibrionales bacterium]